MSAIFISHSNKDKAICLELVERLEEQGHRSLFLDFDPQHGIPAGESELVQARQLAEREACRQQ